MRRSRVLFLVVLTFGWTAVAGTVSAAPRAGGDGGIPADLLAADFGCYVLTQGDVAAIPGLRQGEPFRADAPSALDPDDRDIAACGEVAGHFRAGARAIVSGTVPNEKVFSVTVNNHVGAADDANEALADLEKFAEDCQPFVDGDLVPAARQPNVKKIADGVVAVAVNDLRSPPAPCTSSMCVRANTSCRTSS